MSTEHFLTFTVIFGILVMITHRSGHVYFVGECGNPSEETDCPVEGCFERIGGHMGELVSSNRSGAHNSQKDQKMRVCSSI